MESYHQSKKLVLNGDRIHTLESLLNMDRQLTQREINMLSLLDKLPSMIGYWDKNMNNRFCNQAYSNWFGVGPEQIVGKQLRELLGEEMYRQNLPYIEAVLRGRPQEFERTIPKPDGNGVRYSLTKYIPDIVEGEVQGFFVQVSDITSVKEAEEALRKSSANIQSSEARYRAVVQDQTEIISRLRADGTYIFANEVFLRFFCKSETELIGSKWNPLVYHEDLERVSAELAKLSSVNPVVVIENRVFSGSGRVYWMQFSNRGTFDDAGKLVEIQSVGRDISERKQLEEALTKSEEKYRALFEESIAAIYVFDIHKNFISANQAGLDLLGYPEAELLGMSIPDVDADPVVVLPAQQQPFFGERIVNYEHRLRRNDGRIITVLNNSRSLKDSNGETIGMLSTLIDITQRKELERELVSTAEERNRFVGQELHDHLGQELAAISYLAHSLEKKSKGSCSEAVSSIAKVIATQAQGAVTYCKQLAQGLLPFELETNGLKAALTNFAGRISNTYEVRCDFVCKCEADVFDYFLSLNLYRIAQEATHNAIRHGRASVVIISLKLDGNYFRLSISDDGNGFVGVNERRKSSRGMGVKLMNYRANQIGATLQLRPRAEGGTEVLLESISSQND